MEVSNTNFTESCPVTVALMHADRQTDRRAEMSKVEDALRDHAQAPRNSFS